MLRIQNRVRAPSCAAQRRFKIATNSHRNSREALSSSPISPASIDLLEPRRLLSSGSLSTLVQFDGTDGVAPQAVVTDANGNLFGITYDSTAPGVTYGPGQHGPGEVFEVPAGTQTINVLATFAQDAYVGTSLVIDSSGNLFGTESPDTSDGGSGLPTIIFEIPVGTTTVTPIATVAAGTLGTFTLTAADTSGDVFGISTFNGPFEVAAGSNTVTYLTPTGMSTIDASDLYVASNGIIYGTTYAGGDNSDGSLFEFAAGTHAYTQLASFDDATTGSKPLGVVADSAGNLFGFCENGGPNGNGTVFELPAGASTISPIALFTAATGDTPISRPVLGASGTLYGLTDSDGANGFGSLFSAVTPDATSTAATSVLQGGAGPDRVLNPLYAGAPDVSILDPLTNAQEAGQNTAGIVGGENPGEINDITSTSLNVWGGQFGTNSNPDSVGGSGAIDQYGPASPTTPTDPTLDDLNKANQRLRAAEEAKNDAYKRLKEDINNNFDPIDDGDQYKAATKELNDAQDAFQKAVQAFDQAHAMDEQLTSAQQAVSQALGNEVIIANRPSSELSPATLSAKKLAADEALIAKLGPIVIADYNTMLADTTTIETDTAEVNAFLSSLPTTPALAVTVTKDTLPATAVAGAKLHGAVVLTVANTGSVAKGVAELTLYVSTTPTLTGATQIGTTKRVTLHLLAGRSAKIQVPITSLPATLASGAYYILAQLSFGDLTIAPAASSQTITVSAAT